MKKYTILSLLTAFVLAFTASTAQAEINQQLKNDMINAVDDDTLMIQTIQAPGDSEDDIFMKGIACKRLAVIGTEKAIPALEAMLSNPKLAHYARYALESMPFAAVDECLMKNAKTLNPASSIGVINSIGARKIAKAVPVLKEILAGNCTSAQRQACYRALGYIATDDAAAVLTAATQALKENAEYAVRKALADSMLDCAESYENAGNIQKATALYDACVVPAFPVYAQKAGAYHGLLIRKAGAADALVGKMFSPKECCFSGGLKAIREFADEDGATITKALLARLAELPVDRQALVLRALADRKDAASREIVFPVLCKACQEDSLEIQIAAIQGLAKVGSLNPGKTMEALNLGANREDATERAAILAAMVDTMVALPNVDGILAQNVDKIDLKNVEMARTFLKIIELRRTAAAAPALVKIAKTEGVNPAVRDAVLNAMSEIVTLENLDMLIEALDGETNDGKVDWVLRAACTRFPREECALAVVKRLDAEKDPVEKGKLIVLLKQIGGQTAVAKVASLCWNAETADIATQTLGTWNTPDDILAVADICLKLAKESKDERYQVRGIRAYIRIPRQFDMPKEQKFEMCRTAYATAKRAEDKALIFEVFKRVIDVSSAREAMSYANDPACCEAACDACVAVAVKFQGQSSELKELLAKVLQVSKDEKVKAAAQSAISRLDAMLKDAPLEIISARYGAGDSWRDVTAKIQQGFNGKAALGFAAGNEAFGDPASGQVKTTEIVVKFKATGQQRKLIFQENEPIVFPEK